MTFGTHFLGKLMLSLLPRDLKVSNLLMTDKGCVKTGGCWVLPPHMWEWVSLSMPIGVGDVSVEARDGMSVFLAPGRLR